MVSCSDDGGIDGENGSDGVMHYPLNNYLIAFDLFDGAIVVM